MHSHALRTFLYLYLIQLGLSVLNINSFNLENYRACAVIAAMQGAQIIRVHDVKETVEALRVVEATLAAKGKKRYE